MKKTVVINVVGLSSSLIGEHTPFLRQYVQQQALSVIEPMLPAVTTAVQSTYLTGEWPSQHGIVGNGWYDRTDCEIKFWKQSNKLVLAEKIWDRAKRNDADFTCANMFWWYNMYSTADYSVTPRPNYLADGRKIPDCYSHPADLRDQLQRELGAFPLFKFWGPATSIESTQWITNATLITDERYNATLTLVYLPHLDYCLQQYGPADAAIHPHLREVDKEVEKLVRHFEANNARIIILSEYGITAVDRPIHLNRVLRQQGLLQVRVERGLELLDAGASRAFAVADHQVAHIYCNDPMVTNKVKTIIENVPGVAAVLDVNAKSIYHIDHARAGDLIAISDEHSWFTYYYWEDDSKAPDFARCVDIHKKPGYDPVELFMTSKARAGYKLLRKKAGLRYVMDVIPLDATLVKGSHGAINASAAFHPVLITAAGRVGERLKATEVFEVVWRALADS